MLRVPLSIGASLCMGFEVLDSANSKRNPVSIRPESEDYVILQTKRHHPLVPPRAPLCFVTPSQSIGSRQAGRDRSTRLGATPTKLS